MSTHSASARAAGQAAIVKFGTELAGSWAKNCQAFSRCGMDGVDVALDVRGAQRRVRSQKHLSAARSTLRQLQIHPDQRLTCMASASRTRRGAAGARNLSVLVVSVLIGCWARNNSLRARKVRGFTGSSSAIGSACFAQKIPMQLTISHLVFGAPVVGANAKRTRWASMWVRMRCWCEGMRSAVFAALFIVAVTKVGNSMRESLILGRDAHVDAWRWEYQSSRRAAQVQGQGTPTTRLQVP